jgi:hypothetical protein
MKGSIIFLLFPFLCFAQVNIDVSFDESIFKPKNYVQNPSFEEKANWKEYASKLVEGKWEKTDITGLYTDEEKFSGKFSYKIKGQRGINAGISQDIRFDPPIEPGYIYLSYRIKTKGTINEGGGIGPSIQVRYIDDESKYLSGMGFQKGIYNWEEIRFISEITKPIKSLTLYLTYYDQEGECYYDDVVLSAVKKEKVKYKIGGEEIKKVRIYSEDGLIKESEGCEGEEEILPVKNYYIEVENSKGNKYVKVFPEIKKEEKGGELYITYLKEETIPVKGEKSYRFNIKKEEGKRYILNIKARLRTEKLAGHTNALEINLNGQAITVNRLVERNKNFTTTDGKVYDVGNQNFRIYYSPYFVIPPEDSSYFPVDIPDNDPYRFKFDITDILKDGENIILVMNRSPLKELVIGDCKIITK